MKDYLPEDLAKRRLIERIVRRLFSLYGYLEVETPTLESYDLLAAKVGEETRKSMYAFKDLGGRMVALRPEGTAPIARLMATKLRTAPKPIRLAYLWDFFRYDEPQKGRLRRFYQGGFELLGAPGIYADMEIMTIAANLMTSLGLRKPSIKASHVGIIRSLLAKQGMDEERQNAILALADKKRYEEALERLKEWGLQDSIIDLLSNLFSLKGSIDSVMEEALGYLKDFPEAMDILKELGKVLRYLRDRFSEVEFIIDLGFARGLEYYTGIIFEGFTEGLESAILGGGRYDKLVELYGGDPTPGVGFSAGIDRIQLVMDEQGLFQGFSLEKPLYLVPVKGDFMKQAMDLALKLRSSGVPVEVEILGRSVTRALRYAEAKGFRYVMLLGEREISQGTVSLRDMERRDQRTVKIEELKTLLENERTGDLAAAG
ncbi:histidine--tRNA ligase [Candidatus Bathyarchaeota archaeon]|nr:histidine--tRNA ligase [Candidatus Bathyarchaeota archaeon]